MDPKIWLKPGDVVRIAIDQLGVLENRWLMSPPVQCSINLPTGIEGFSGVQARPRPRVCYNGAAQLPCLSLRTP